MRLTQFRIHAVECSGGLVSVALAKVFYERGRVAGHEIVLMDWCEPGQLEAIAGQFLRECADSAYRSGLEGVPRLPI